MLTIGSCLHLLFQTQHGGMAHNWYNLQRPVAFINDEGGKTKFTKDVKWKAMELTRFITNRSVVRSQLEAFFRTNMGITSPVSKEALIFYWQRSAFCYYRACRHCIHVNCEERAECRHTTALRAAPANRTANHLWLLNIDITGPTNE